MNQAIWRQISEQVKLLVAFLAGTAVTLGYMKPDQVAVLSDNISTLVTALGTLAGAIVAIWGAISKTRNAIIAQTAALPEVSKVVVSTPAIVDNMPPAAQGTVITTRTDNEGRS